MVIGNQNHQPIEGIPAHQGINEHLDSQWCYLVTSDAPIHNVPEVPNLSQVWGVDGINAFTIQKWPIHSSHMRPEIVVHQEGPSAHCTSRSDSGSEDFIPVFNTSNGTID